MKGSEIDEEMEAFEQVLTYVESKREFKYDEHNEELKKHRPENFEELSSNDKLNLLILEPNFNYMKVKDSDLALHIYSVLRTKELAK